MHELRGRTASPGTKVLCVVALCITFCVYCNAVWCSSAVHSSFSRAHNSAVSGPLLLSFGVLCVSEKQLVRCCCLSFALGSGQKGQVHDAFWTAKMQVEHICAHCCGFWRDCMLPEGIACLEGRGVILYKCDVFLGGVQEKLLQTDAHYYP